MASLEYLNRTLKQSCRKRDFEKIILSIQKGADPDCTIRTKYAFDAVGYMDFSLMKVLVENGALLHQNNNQLLTFAVENNNLEIVQWLLGNTKHVEIEKNLKTCAVNGFVDILNSFYEHNTDCSRYGEICMRLAITASQYKAVKFFIEKGVSVNGIKDAPLARAALNNNVDIARLLVDNGADPNANKYEAVKYAAFKDSIDVIQYLADKIDKNIGYVVLSEIGPKVEQWLNAKIMSDELNDQLETKQQTKTIKKI